MNKYKTQEIKFEDHVDGNIVIKLKRYETVEQLHEKCLGAPLSEFDGFCGLDRNGKEHKITIPELMETLKEVGCYAFAKSEDREIHFWLDEGVCDKSEFISMIAHEIGHIKKPWYKDEMKEEMKAERYGIVASFAYDIMKKLF